MEPLPGAHRASLGVRARDAIRPEIRQRAGVQPDRLQCHPDLIAIERRDQTRAVIDVRVCQSDHVDAASPGRKARAELLHKTRGVGTAVDEQRRAADLHQIRIALTDVERAHAHIRIRARPGEDARDDEQGHRE